MRKFTFVVLLFASLVQSAAALAGLPGAAGERDAFTSLLRQSESDALRRRSRILITEYGWSAEERAHPEAVLASNFDEREKLGSRQLDVERGAQNTLITEGPVEGRVTLPGYSGAGYHHWTDGLTWCHYDEVAEIARLQPVESRRDADPFINLFDRIAWPSFASRSALSQVVSVSPQFDVQSDGALDRLTCAWTGARTRVELWFTRSGGRELVRVRLTTQGDGGALLQCFDMQLSDYRDGVPWLGRAVSWVRTPSGAGAAGGLKLVYRRESSERLVASEPAAPSLSVGVWIADSRIGAAYAIGDSRVQVAGLRLGASGPITDWLNFPKALPELLGGGEELSQPMSVRPRTALIWATAILAAVAVVAALTGARKSRPSKLRQRLLVMTSLAVVALGCSALLIDGRRKAADSVIYASQIPSQPLRGNDTAQFPPAKFSGEPLKLDARFELRNDSDVAKRVSKIVTSCGCTGAQASSNEIPAGGTVVINAQLKLETPGDRASQVWITFADSTLQTLSLRGSCFRSTDSFVWPRVRLGEPGSEYVGVLVSPRLEVPQIFLSSSATDGEPKPKYRLDFDRQVVLGAVEVDGVEMAVRWYRAHASKASEVASPGVLDLPAIEGSIPWN